MSKEGPYRVKEDGGWWWVMWKQQEVDRFRNQAGADRQTYRLNAAYAAGRASRDAEVKELVEAARGVIKHGYGCDCLDQMAEALKAFTQPSPASVPADPLNDAVEREIGKLMEPKPHQTEEPHTCENCGHAVDEQHCDYHGPCNVSIKHISGWTPRTSR